MKHKLFSLILKVLPKSLAHRILYSRRTGKKLNLKNPIDLNEKLQYLIIYKFNEKEAYLSDKYLVKEHIKKMNVSNLNIVKTLGVYKTVDEIDLSKLPNEFILKCNHGSGKVFICMDKKTFDFDEAKKELKKELKEDYSNNLLEHHYQYISPVIIAEEHLNDNGNKNPIDYKFYCFNGKVINLLVCSERETGLRLNDYDINWNELENVKNEFRGRKKIEKPQNFDKMIKICEKLSKGIPFVRIDLYNIDGKIYFGEFTFTPMGGVINYYTDDALKFYGDLIDLNLYDAKENN